MNWLDFCILLILLFFSLEGIGRSFVLEFLDFLSFLLAFFLSLKFFNYPALFYEDKFMVGHSISTVLGFITVWFLTEALFFTIVHAFFIKYAQKFAYWRFNQLLNHLSLIPAFLRGLVFICIILVLIGSFPIQLKIKSAVYNSKLGSAILSYTQSLEQPLKNVFGEISQESISFLTIKPKSGELVNLGFSTVEFKPNVVLEERMVNLVNKERTNRRLKPLEFKEELREIGRLHSADMFKKGYFSHYSPEGKNVADRAKEFGVQYLVIGENLAYAPSLELAHNGLMNSEGHRANILSKEYNKIGIGIMDGGVYGLMVTQVFSD